MFTLNIKKAEKITVIATQEDMISVQFDIVSTDDEGNETVAVSLAHGFSVEATEEEIRAALQKVCDTYGSDSERIEELKKVEEENKKVNETINKLNGVQESGENADV